jgi:hypothetical protein
MLRYAHLHFAQGYFNQVFLIYLLLAFSGANFPQLISLVLFMPTS